jgi:hypothetical protein
MISSAGRPARIQSGSPPIDDPAGPPGHPSGAGTAGGRGPDPVPDSGPISTRLELPKAQKHVLALDFVLSGCAMLALGMFLSHAVTNLPAAPADYPLYAKAAVAAFGINVVLFVLWHIIVPVHHPLFVPLSYIRHFQGREAGALEVARACRKLLVRYLRFDFSFEKEYLLRSLNSLADHREHLRWSFLKQQVERLKIYRFLLEMNTAGPGNLDQELELLQENGQTLFLLSKRHVLLALSILNGVMIPSVASIILGMFHLATPLNVGLLFGAFVILYLPIGHFRAYFKLRGAEALYYYGILRRRQQDLEYLKYELQTRIMKPHMGRAIALSAGALFIGIGIGRSISLEMGHAALALWLLTIPSLARNIWLYSLYSRTAALLGAGRGLEQKEEDVYLQKTSRTIGLDGDAYSKVRDYLKVDFWFFLVAGLLPGLNFIISSITLYSVVYQYGQKDTAALLKRSGGFGRLILLAALGIIPVIGSLFSLGGAVCCLLLRHRFAQARHGSRTG